MYIAINTFKKIFFFFFSYAKTKECECAISLMALLFCTVSQYPEQVLARANGCGVECTANFCNVADRERANVF